MFVTFITIFSSFSNGYSNLTPIEILVLLSWIPASKEFWLWKFSNFPAILIIREINFGWVQRVKTVISTILEAMIFWEFHSWKCQKYPKIQNSELLKRSHWHFLGLLNDQNWFQIKIWVAGKSWNFHIVYSQFSCPLMYLLCQILAIFIGINSSFGH